MTNYSREEDYLDMNEDSDNECDTSSEEELDFTFLCSKEKKVRIRHRSVSSHESSGGESDFEKEMNEELDRKVSALEAACKTNKRKLGKSDSEQDGGAGCSKNQEFEDGDDVYYDSDEEEMVEHGNKKKKDKENLSNDDLLYDPDLDDLDQKWVDNHRKSYSVKGNKQAKKLPQSDAVLDCPACMTTLCLDCQRHDTYMNQYRAMFVMNCKVDTTEVLKNPHPKPKKKQKKSIDTSTTECPNSEEEKLHPVRCTECNTVVGVFDKEEVYHFFNVLASH